MARLRRLFVRCGGALCVLAVAALAAACAHEAIDLLGDVLLVHDTYDDIAHDARSVGAAVAVGALLAAAARSIFDGVRARAGAPAARRAFRPPLVPFVTAAVAGSAPMLALMEYADARLAGVEVDDLADVLGGSIALGSLTLIVVGTIVALLAVGALRAFCSARASIVRRMCALVERLRRTGQPRLLGAPCAPRPRSISAFVARHAALRGPPARFA